MYLKDLANVIYTEDTTSENTHITVETSYNDVGESEILWEGKAKDLKTMENIGGWVVVEILVDRSGEDELNLPDHDKGKIVTVV